MSWSWRLAARIILRVVQVVLVLASLAILALWFLHERNVVDMPGMEPIYTGVGLAVTGLVWLLDRLVGRQRPATNLGAKAVAVGKKARVEAPILTGDSAQMGDVIHGNLYQAERIKIVHEHGRERRVPWQLPGRPVNFTGRKDDVTWLMEALRPGRTVTVWGPGGVGKSALAAEALRRLDETGALAERFPDGMIFYSFYGRPDTARALEHIVKSFDSAADPGGQTVASGAGWHRRGKGPFGSAENHRRMWRTGDEPFTEGYGRSALAIETGALIAV
jgi:hypothetical protein